MSIMFIAATLAASRGATAQDVMFQSPDHQSALLELYTSEGCSSCPPAENWLSRLKTSPRLWREFVPVAFHVDYWDYLGWRDPWGAKEFSNRQRAYAKTWGSETIYTPDFVLNGKEWRDWSAHKDGPPLVARTAGVLAVKSSTSNRWDVTFTSPTSANENYQVHAALLASGLHSDVKAGENRGSRLDHDFIALSLVETPLAKADGVYRGDFALPIPSANAAQLGLAVWITKTGRFDVLQATGGWLGDRPSTSR